MDLATTIKLLKTQIPPTRPSMGPNAGQYQDFNTDAQIARNSAAKVTANPFLHQGLPGSFQGLGPGPAPSQQMQGGGHMNETQKMPFYPDDNPNQPGVQKLAPIDKTPIQQTVPWTPKYLLDALKGPGWEAIQ